jgi:hypothetical protein
VLKLSLGDVDFVFLLLFVFTLSALATTAFFAGGVFLDENGMMMKYVYVLLNAT